MIPEQFHPWWTSEDKVNLILSMEHLTWKLPALQKLVSLSLINVFPDLQCRIDVDVFLSLHGRVCLQFTLCTFYYRLLHVTTHWRIIITIPEGIEARSQVYVHMAVTGEQWREVEASEIFVNLKVFKLSFQIILEVVQPAYQILTLRINNPEWQNCVK